MFRGISVGQEKLLRERLRQEAEQALPPASEPFHGRLCQAIRQADISDSQACPEPAPVRLFPYWVPAAVAAACLLSVGALLWHALGVSPNRNKPDVDPSQVAQTPVENRQTPVDLTPLTQLGDVAVAQITAFVDATAASSQWAYLNHDAQLALHMFVDRFPFTPLTAEATGGVSKSLSH